jgi:amidohydrolase
LAKRAGEHPEFDKKPPLNQAQFDERHVRALKATASEAVDRAAPDLITLADTIHANPETRFNENAAVAMLTQVLTDYGYTSATGVAGLQTAFVAGRPCPRPGRSVAFVAEYDALQGLGHACGHNLIAAAAVGAAIALARITPDLKGEVRVIGTPAEEGGGGKAIMLDSGVFDDVDTALMVHPGNRTSPVSYSLASYPFKVEFFGKAAHAAIEPHEGINALDAMILSFNAINALRQQVRDGTRIHGYIAKGGVSANTVPDHTVAEFRVRAPSLVYLDTVKAKVERILEASASATGCAVTIEWMRGYAEMRNNQALASAFADNIGTLGLAIDDCMPGEWIGSTDMGNVSQVVPALHALIAIGGKELSLHTPAFAEAAKSENAHRSLIQGAKALAMTAIDVLTNDELAARVEAEFALENRSCGRQNGPNDPDR